MWKHQKKLPATDHNKAVKVITVNNGIIEKLRLWVKICLSIVPSIKTPKLIQK